MHGSGNTTGSHVALVGPALQVGRINASPGHIIRGHGEHISVTAAGHHPNLPPKPTSLHLFLITLGNSTILYVTQVCNLDITFNSDFSLILTFSLSLILANSFCITRCGHSYPSTKLTTSSSYSSVTETSFSLVLTNESYPTHIHSEWSCTGNFPSLLL